MIQFIQNISINAELKKQQKTASAKVFELENLLNEANETISTIKNAFGNYKLFYIYKKYKLFIYILYYKRT